MIKKVGRQAGRQAARQRELSMHTISIAIDSKWKKKALDYISMFSQAVRGPHLNIINQKKKTQKTRGFWERSLLLILLKPPKLLASNRKRLDVGPETEIATVISS